MIKQRLQLLLQSRTEIILTKNQMLNVLGWVLFYRKVCSSLGVTAVFSRDGGSLQVLYVTT